jgi:hypothetical protein
LKIRHSDKQWVGKLFILISTLIILFLLGCIVKLIIPTKSANPTLENLSSENTLTYVTKQVVDYESKGKPNRWEIRYDIWNSSSSLYKNEKCIKKLTYGELDKIVDFEPEALVSSHDFTEELNTENDTGIIYEMDLKSSERYIASFLSRGYSYRRKILTPTYAEVYLYDAVGNTIRVLAFQDKLLIATLYEDTTLPRIEGYFK